jgi:hypothetical protein
LVTPPGIEEIASFDIPEKAINEKDNGRLLDIVLPVASLNEVLDFKNNSVVFANCVAGVLLVGLFDITIVVSELVDPFEETGIFVTIFETPDGKPDKLISLMVKYCKLSISVIVKSLIFDTKPLADTNKLSFKGFALLIV